MGRMQLAEQIAFVSRLTLIVSAAGAVAISAALSWTCGRIVGVHQITGLHVLYGVEPATAFAIQCTFFAVLKPPLGVLIAAASVPRLWKCACAAFWLMLLLFSWSINASCVVTDIKEGIAAVAAILVTEILSGCLPALVYVVCQSRRTVPPGVPPAIDPLPQSTGQPAPPVQIAPTPQAATVEHPEPTPTFPDVQTLVRHVQNFGSRQFPGIRLNADSSLLAGQRAYARILGISLGACNELLHRESEAGRLLMTCSGRGTRIALPTGDAS